MPNGTHRNAMVRQWEMLKMLPSKRPGITVRGLKERLEHEGFVVHRRTIERDLITLSTVFSVVCNDLGSPVGWHWMQGESANLPSLTIADAVSLKIVEDLVRPLLPGAVLESLEPRLRQARVSLNALSELKHARWIDKVRHVSPAMPLLPPHVDPAVLEVLQEALLQERQIQATYLKPRIKDSSEIRLHPLGLVQRGPVGYLVATAFQYGDVRLYAIHRFQKAEVTKDPIDVPERFSLDDFIAKGSLHFGNSESIKLVAYLSDNLASILEETPLSEGQIITVKDGKRLVEATLTDSWQLLWWILSHGPAVEVLEPSSLRKRVAEQLHLAAARYPTE